MGSACQVPPESASRWSVVENGLSKDSKPEERTLDELALGIIVTSVDSPRKNKRRMPLQCAAPLLCELLTAVSQLSSQCSACLLV